MSEFCSYNSRIAVWSRHLSPYHSDFRPLAFFLSSVYECDFLAEVESARPKSVSGGRYTFFESSKEDRDRTAMKMSESFHGCHEILRMLT